MTNGLMTCGTNLVSALLWERGRGSIVLRKGGASALKTETAQRLGSTRVPRGSALGLPWLFEGDWLEAKIFAKVIGNFSFPSQYCLVLSIGGVVPNVVRHCCEVRRFWRSLAVFCHGSIDLSGGVGRDVVALLGKNDFFRQSGFSQKSTRHIMRE